MDTHRKLDCSFIQARAWTSLSISAQKVFLVNIIVLSNSFRGGYSRGDRSEKDDDDDEQDNWYQLWYFWLIVSLFLVGVLLLVFIYCKQQAKQARLEGMGRIRAQMVLPPAYDEPVHLPPPYSVAAAVSDSVQPAHLHNGQFQRTSRGYIPASAIDAFTFSHRAESAPPPYSPPPYCVQEGPGDTRYVGDEFPLPSPSSSPQPEAIGPPHGSSSGHQELASQNTSNQLNPLNRSRGVQQEATHCLSISESVYFQDHRERLQDIHQLADYAFYNNPNPTTQSCSNSSAFSIHQTQLSINPRGASDNAARQYYDPSAHEVSRIHSGTERPILSSAPCPSQDQPITNSGPVAHLPSSSSGLRATVLGSSAHNERFSLGASVSRDSSRLVTSLSYNMSDSAPAGTDLNRPQRRNAPTSGKTQNKHSTSILGNRSTTNAAFSSTSTANAEAPRTSGLSNRNASRQLHNPQHSRVPQHQVILNPLMSPKSL